METLCDYCNQKKATESCEVCGANVCSEHKLDYGCKVCDGGKKTFE
jgi:methionyl-tRNA synthetase